MAGNPSEFRKRHGLAIARLYALSGAARWSLPEEDFADALMSTVSAWAAGRAKASVDEIDQFLAGIRSEDLALAQACLRGSTDAWEYFVEHYRAGLHVAARSIVHDEAAARDLADSLYAELYGFGEDGGARRPLLAYFHGRSSMRTWMRAVMAQRHVDSLRAARRREAILAVADPEVPWEQSDPKRASYVEAIARALSAALDELKARDRMRLNFYYSDELTLKQIGELMNESESSASRRLARTRKQLRRAVERKLRREQHFDEQQIRLCYAYAMEAGTAEVGPLLANSRTAPRSQSGDEHDFKTGQAGLKPGQRRAVGEAHVGPVRVRDGK